MRTAEQLMTSLVGLNIGIGVFNMTDEQRIEIESKMRKCGKCFRWKYNEDLSDDFRCVKCGGDVPEKKVKRKKKVERPGSRKKSNIKLTDDQRKQAVIDYDLAVKNRSGKIFLLENGFSRVNILHWKRRFFPEKEIESIKTSNMSKRKRREFSDSQKEKIVLEYREAIKEKKGFEVLKKHNITSSQMCGWQKKFPVKSNVKIEVSQESIEEIDRDLPEIKSSVDVEKMFGPMNETEIKYLKNKIRKLERVILEMTMEKYNHKL